MTKFTVGATMDIFARVEAGDIEQALDAAEPIINAAWDVMADAVGRVPGASISGTYDDWEATINEEDL